MTASGWHPTVHCDVLSVSYERGVLHLFHSHAPCHSRCRGTCCFFFSRDWCLSLAGVTQCAAFLVHPPGNVTLQGLLWWVLAFLHHMPLYALVIHCSSRSQLPAGVSFEPGSVWPVTMSSSDPSKDGAYDGDSVSLATRASSGRDQSGAAAAGPGVLVLRTIHLPAARLLFPLAALSKRLARHYSVGRLVASLCMGRSVPASGTDFASPVMPRVVLDNSGEDEA